MKKESRILGLSVSEVAGKEIAVIGVVFRGNQWLDGIITCALRSSNPDNVKNLARTITGCKQYSQIRTVILARERFALGTRNDVSALSNIINLPVMAIIRDGSAQD